VRARPKAARFARRLHCLFLNQGQTKAVGYLNPGKMTNQQRIDNAKIDVEQMKQNPAEVGTVLVSFNGLKKKDFVKDLVTNRNVKVKRMYHAYKANKTHTGGYLLKDGETIDAALITYKKDLQDGIKRHGTTVWLS
jgi:ribosomal protein L3